MMPFWVFCGTALVSGLGFSFSNRGPFALRFWSGVLLLLSFAFISSDGPPVQQFYMEHFRLWKSAAPLFDYPPKPDCSCWALTIRIWLFLLLAWIARDTWNRDIFYVRRSKFFASWALLQLTISCAKQPRSQHPRWDIKVPAPLYASRATIFVTYSWLNDRLLPKQRNRKDGNG